MKLESEIFFIWAWLLNPFVVYRFVNSWATQFGDNGDFITASSLNQFQKTWWVEWRYRDRLMLWQEMDESREVCYPAALASLLAAYVFNWPGAAVVLMAVSTSPVDWGTTSYVGNLSMALTGPTILMDLFFSMAPPGQAITTSVHLVLSFARIGVLWSVFMIPTLFTVFMHTVVWAMWITFSIACNCPSQPFWASAVIAVGVANVWLPPTLSIGLETAFLEDVYYSVRVVVMHCLIMGFWGCVLNLVRNGWARYVRVGTRKVPYHLTFFFYWSSKEYEMVPLDLLLLHAVVAFFHMLYMPEFGIAYCFEHS